MTTPDSPSVALSDGEHVLNPEGLRRRARAEILGLLLLLLGCCLLGVALWTTDVRLFFGAVGAVAVAGGWRLTAPPEA